MRRAFVLGKFMPPHKGHVLLCEFAAGLVDQLTILVCSLPDDSMPGALRYAWMRELFPNCRVRWCNEILPQAPKDDPQNFWPIWRDVVKRYHPEPIDIVAASEPYGLRLAQEVGARFAPCDIARAAAPVSGTAIRAAPFKHWRFIPEAVRPHFVKRVCLFGPESSGKTTLANALADRLDTVVASEFGRTYTEMHALDLKPADFGEIARGQAALTNACLPLANRVLIEDTDAMLTGLWAEMLIGHRPEGIEPHISPADLYLLCDVDFPWVDDGTRYFADEAQRRRFAKLCRDELDRRGVPYIIVDGAPERRLARAEAEVRSRFGL